MPACRSAKGYAGTTANSIACIGFDTDKRNNDRIYIYHYVIAYSAIRIGTNGIAGQYAHNIIPIRKRTIRIASYIVTNYDTVFLPLING